MGMFDGIVSSVVGAVGGLLGGQQTNQANWDVAQANNQWSAQQFATRYQTTVKDLEAAGLNPMLAYTQGGGSPPQAQTVAPRVNSIGNATEAALTARQSAADIRLKDEQTAATTAQTEVYRTQALANIAEEARKKQDTQTSAAVEQVNRKQLDAIAAEIDMKKASTVATTAQAARTAIETMRAKQESEIRKPEEAKSKTWWGKNVSPYIQDFTKGVSSASQAAGALK